MGGKNVITEPREGEYVPIEGLEVEVAPRAAHTAIVSRISSCELKLAVKNDLKSPASTSTCPKLHFLTKCFLPAYLHLLFSV